MFRVPILAQPENVAEWPEATQAESSIEPQPDESTFKWLAGEEAKADADAKTLQIERSTAGDAGIRFQTSSEIADDAISFQYFIPQECPAVELQVSVWLKGGNEEYVAHLDPVKGRWVSDQWRLSDIIGGDRWRLDPKVREAAAVGFRLKMSDGGSWRLRKVQIQRLPISFNPLAIPSLLTVSGPKGGTVQLMRDFTVEGKPEEEWGQVILDEPWKVWLNDKLIASSDTFSEKAALWPDLGSASRGQWNRAADFSLSELAEGQNVLRIEMPSNSRATVAVGWQENGQTRAVIVSDDNWKAMDSQNQAAATISIAPTVNSGGNLTDIYPLRIPKEWMAPAAAQKVSEWPKTEIKSVPLTPRVEKGKWSVAQFTEYGDRWFFRDPSGKPFFVLGSQTVGLLRENYAYYRHVTVKWPAEKEWAHDAVVSLKGLGFNTVAVASTWSTAFDEAGKEGMVGFQYLGSPLRGPFLANASGKGLPGVPDPFDESWRQSFRHAAEAKAALWNQQDNIIGFFVNNEMPADGNITNGSMLGYVYSQACGQEFVKWLKNRYGDVQKLNEAWYGDNTKHYHSSFEAILIDKPDPGPFRGFLTDIPGLNETRPNLEMKKAFTQDFSDFSVYTMQEYADYMLNVLRGVMPNKLIGTNRFQGGATDGLLAAWKDYDFIAWNAYPIWEQGQKSFTPAQLATMRHAFELTGKPLLITEWGTASYEARLPGSVISFATYTEQGTGYHKVIEQLYGLPFVMGAIHFAWQDLPDKEREAWGIIDSEDRPRSGFVDGIANANQWLDSQWIKNKMADKKNP